MTRPGAVARSGSNQGELAIVLHTHMPYVEGFGTWPFGEEWLWEAIATSYLPLLEVLGRGALTLSLSPVLCDQLERPDAIERCLRFLREIRAETHARDLAELRERGEDAAAAELERSAAAYARAADRLEQLRGPGLLAALGAHASWTSAATHAVLPLVATDAGVNLQIQTGVASHRRRFGAWEGGFWLPECAHTPWLDPLLEEAGVRGACVELTSRFGLGDPRHLTPVRSDDGPVLWPIDRQTISLVWSDQGYPAGPVYRDRHRPTTHLHHAWRNDGAPYDHRAAQDQARADARDFVARVRERVAGGGVCVCALDTELLGHWWHEGIWWLAAVIEEAGDQDLPLTGLDDALARHPPEPAPLDLAVTTWGEGEDLRTWSGPAVAELAWAARTAELEALAAGRGVGALAAGRGVGPRAVRELLALQSSDWAFLASRGTAGDYPIERARAHRQNFERALAGDPELQPELRGLAPDLVT